MAPKRIPMIGRKFGRLTIVELHGREGYKFIWKCCCDCGKRVNTDGSRLRSGKTSSCGCRSREVASLMMRTHGQSKTPEFRIWSSMIHRCSNENAANYHRYGGRGIKVCGRWRESFTAFLGDMGRRLSSHYTLDRIDNDGDYEPGNCRWATVKTQSRNRRSNNLLAVNGVTKCLTEWAEEAGVSRPAIWLRLRGGASPEDAILSKQDYQRRRQ